MGNRAAGYLHGRVAAWRSGTPKSQAQVALILLAIIAASFVVSVTAPEWMPLAAYFVWLLMAMMLLRFRPLVLVGVANAAAGVVALAINNPITGSGATAVAVFVFAALLVLLVAGRQRSGLPAMLSEAFLTDLRDRLQAQGRIPPLPEGWSSQSAMIASHGVTYAGDFLVADLGEDRKRLEVILVDVCGNGTGAGPAALQFAGALGGLIGALRRGSCSVRPTASSSGKETMRRSRQRCTCWSTSRWALTRSPAPATRGAALGPAFARVGHRQRTRYRPRRSPRP
jgi:hypothetical protein